MTCSTVGVSSTLERSAARTLARAAGVTEKQVIDLAIALLFEARSEDGRPTEEHIKHVRDMVEMHETFNPFLHDFQMQLGAAALTRLGGPPTGKELERALSGREYLATH